MMWRHGNEDASTTNHWDDFQEFCKYILVFHRFSRQSSRYPLFLWVTHERHAGAGWCP